MKMTSKEFQERRQDCREQGLVEGSVWQHYKGGVYVIDGFGIETHHGGFLVRYHRIAGPRFDAVAEEGIQFFRPPEEWFEAIQGSNEIRFFKIDN